RDTRIVDHFGLDYRVVGGRDERDVVVVRARQERRTGIEADNATFAERARLRTLGRASTATATGASPAATLASLRLRGQRRHPPVRRVDDERGLLRADDLRAAVVPAIVVRAADVRRGAFLPVLILYGRGSGLLLERGRFLRGVGRLVAKVRRPLERRDRGEAPITREVR